MYDSNWPEWLHIAKEFQTSIAALIGFTGVIIALIMNAWLPRRSRVLEIEHEREVLRIALVGEIEAARTVFDFNLKRLQRMDEKGMTGKPTEFDVDALTPIYTSNLGKLGLLTSEEIFLLTSLHTGIRSAARFNNSYVAPDKEKQWLHGQTYNCMSMMYLFTVIISKLNENLSPAARFLDMAKGKPVDKNGHILDTDFDPLAPPLYDDREPSGA